MSSSSYEVDYSFVDVPGARLAYWDSSGSGPVIVLMHARSGSLNSWQHQRSAFVDAGFRVIAYSRRGHEGTTHTEVGYGADDLLALLDHVKVQQCHLFGHAAGGLWALDFALTHPSRLLSLSIACSTFGIKESEFSEAVESLRPSGFEELPPEFRELSPGYRYSNPRGVGDWLAIERRALNDDFFYQGFRSPMNWSALENMRVPTLLITADCDLYMPPVLMNEVATHIDDVHQVTIINAGHCPHWEQPAALNRELIEFYRMHPSRGLGGRTGR